MDNNYGLHLRAFNDKVSVMNQTRAAQINLSANDARNLQSDIFALLAHVSSLSQQLENAENPVVQVSMDGGSFK